MVGGEMLEMTNELLKIIDMDFYIAAYFAASESIKNII